MEKWEKSFMQQDKLVGEDLLTCLMKWKDILEAIKTVKKWGIGELAEPSAEKEENDDEKEVEVELVV